MADAERSLPKTLYLIDGSAYIYRAFFALPPLSNSKGQQTNAVYGFTTMLLKVLREHTPDCLAIVFDEKGPTQRHEEFKAYKAQRPEMPQGMQSQIPLIHRVVEAMAVPVIRHMGLEADDLIGTLARRAEEAGLGSHCKTTTRSQSMARGRVRTHSRLRLCVGAEGIWPPTGSVGMVALLL